jgi:hypothetical protein
MASGPAGVSYPVGYSRRALAQHQRGEQRLDVGDVARFISAAVPLAEDEHRALEG